MFSNFDDDYTYSGSYSRPSTFRGQWSRGQPAYQEPEAYDTSRFMRNEEKPLSPRRPNHSHRSPLWRNTPSPPPAPLPSGPSSDYISISEEKMRIVDPNEQRKLLILDLNGALLWRKDRRVPYPRPYMPSFRAYLFAEETRKWLDVMVWSSAQPHNVEMMVRRCFYDKRCGYDPEEAKPETGKWEGLLVDVWARDKLGLSSHDYSRKSQTTKDLSKPWTLLQTSQQHSAYTTLLLDDSPAKVRLQPYNHLCVPEYDEKRRSRDLLVKVQTKKVLATDENGIIGQSAVAGTPVSDAATVTDLLSGSIISSDAPSIAPKGSLDSCEEDFSATPTSGSGPMENESHPESVEKTRVEKRKEKKERKKHESALRKLEEQAAKVLETIETDEKAAPADALKQAPMDGSTEVLRSKELPSETDNDEDQRLDETLLAAIGILDEMKVHGNVAAWIKGGGLWAGNTTPASSHSKSADLSSLYGEDVKRAPSPTDAEVDDLHPYVPDENTAASPSITPSSPPTSPDAALHGSSSRPTSPQHSSPDRKRYRSVTADAPSAREGESDLKKSKIVQPKDGAIPAGNDAETIGSKSPKRVKGADQTVNEVSTNRGGAEGDLTVGPDTTVPKMWFEDEGTFRIWVNRGRAALKSLGIEEHDGIEIP